MLVAMGRYEEAIASFDAVIAFGRELGRPVRVLLNYSTSVFRETSDLDEARRRSEESLTITGRSTSFHMPWMNALVDLIDTDVLAGEIGAAETRWRKLWDDVLATPAWEQWLLAGRMAALRAQIAAASESPEATAEWAERAIAMASRVRRVKYEAVARAVLGRALLGMGLGQDALRELRAAVSGADALGNPAGGDGEPGPTLLELSTRSGARGARRTRTGRPRGSSAKPPRPWPPSGRNDSCQRPQ